MTHSTIDLVNTLSAQKGATPAVRTSAVNGAALDMQGMRAGLILFDVGASGDTLSPTVYWTLKIQESDDNTNWTDVADSDVIGPAANAVVIDSNTEDETVIGFGYAGTKQYVRGVATPTGTHTNGTPIGIVNVGLPLAVPPPDARKTDTA